MHVYFVAYDVPSRGDTGNMEVRLDHEITGIDQVREIERHIGITFVPPVGIVVSNWILLSKSDD
jgi:hypothetical protein